MLRNKLERPATADSLLWKVVREYPGTEAQIAARDYLESAGQTVPTELIKLPEPEIPPRDTTVKQSAPPPGPMPIGPRPAPSPFADSLGAGRQPVTVGPTTMLTPPTPGRPDSVSIMPRLTPQPGPGFPGRPGPIGLVDSLAPRPDTTRRIPPFITPRVPTDTTLRAFADSTRRKVGPFPGRVPADTTRPTPAFATARTPTDTTRRAPADTTKPAQPRRRWVPPDSVQRSPR